MSAAGAGAVPLQAACVRADEQPCASVAHAHGKRRGVAVNAHLFTQLRGAVQWTPWAYGYALGGALQGVPGRFRALLSGLQPLHRAEPGTSMDGWTPLGASLVQLCRQRWGAGRRLADAAPG